MGNMLGGSIAGHMEGVMDKNQEIMKSSQIDMLERQIQMNNFMRERQMAMQVARGRDLFHWWAAFYILAATGMTKGYLNTKKPAMLAPLLPLTFIVAYQADLAYGNKMTRVRAGADKILEEEMGMLSLPGGGLPTVEQLDKLRKK